MLIIVCFQQYSSVVGALNNGNNWHEAGMVGHEDDENDPVIFRFPPGVYS